jgi:release factor glutamine methyltransferase
VTDRPTPDGSPDDTDSDAETSRSRLADRRGMETRVYQPAEDSALLAAAAVDHAGGRVLDVGTGSGWVAERVVEAGTADAVVASDVNPYACRSARERAAGRFEVVRADLFGPFRDGVFETVLFNPPYLPTDPDAEFGDWMEVALSGGESGRAVLDPFVDDVGRVLAPGGRALVVVSTLTGLDAVRARARARGLAVETVRRESYPFETLSVLSLSP